MLLAMLVTGCAPLVVAWPPPSMLPTQVVPLAPAEVELGAGVSPLVVGTTGANGLQGSWGGQAGIGIGHDLSLSLNGSEHLLGPTGAATLWWWPVETDRIDAGAILGVGASWSKSSFTVEDPVVDDDGEPVVDEDGEPVTTDRTTDYSYASIAPAVGAQVAFKAGKVLSFPVLTRVSYSRTFAHSGVDGARWAAWAELAAGARVALGRYVALGAGPQALWLVASGDGGTPAPLVSVVLSLEARLGGEPGT